MIVRLIIFSAYYPSLIFVSRDKVRFVSEFAIAQVYLIPVMDFCNLILAGLHLFIFFSTKDKHDFFSQSLKKKNHWIMSISNGYGQIL